MIRQNVPLSCPSGVEINIKKNHHHYSAMIIQAGLSYITGDPTVPSGLSLDAIVNISTSHQVFVFVKMASILLI